MEASEHEVVHDHVPVTGNAQRIRNVLPPSQKPYPRDDNVTQDGVTVSPGIGSGAPHSAKFERQAAVPDLHDPFAASFVARAGEDVPDHGETPCRDIHGGRISPAQEADLPLVNIEPGGFLFHQEREQGPEDARLRMRGGDHQRPPRRPAGHVGREPSSLEARELPVTPLRHPQEQRPSLRVEAGAVGKHHRSPATRPGRLHYLSFKQIAIPADLEAFRSRKDDDFAAHVFEPGHGGHRH